MNLVELQAAIALVGPEMAKAMGYYAMLERMTRADFEAWYSPEASEMRDSKGGYGAFERCHINASWIGFKAGRGLIDA